MSRYLRYSALTESEKKWAGNGCGPSWLPEKIKTSLFNWFFLASCDHHDFGYIVGGNEWRRWVCDWKFFSAMFRDSTRGGWLSCAYQLPVALVFYLCVIICGWASFSYRKPITSKSEFINKRTVKTLK